MIILTVSGTDVHAQNLTDYSIDRYGIKLYNICIENNSLKGRINVEEQMNKYVTQRRNMKETYQ